MESSSENTQTTVLENTSASHINARTKWLFVIAGLLLALAMVLTAVVLITNINSKKDNIQSSSSSDSLASSTQSSSTTSVPVETKTTTINFGEVAVYTFTYPLPSGFTFSLVDENDINMAYSFFDLTNTTEDIKLHFSTDPDTFPMSIPGNAAVTPISNSFHAGINRVLLENNRAVYGTNITSTECAFRESNTDNCLDYIDVPGYSDITVACSTVSKTALTQAQLALCDMVVSGLKAVAVQTN